MWIQSGTCGMIILETKWETLLYKVMPKLRCFDLLFQTIGAAFGAKSLTVGGNKSVTLGIWVSHP